MEDKNKSWLNWSNILQCKAFQLQEMLHFQKHSYKTYVAITMKNWMQSTPLKFWSSFVFQNVYNSPRFLVQFFFYKIIKFIRFWKYWPKISYWACFLNELTFLLFYLYARLLVWTGYIAKQGIRGGQVKQFLISPCDVFSHQNLSSTWQVSEPVINSVSQLQIHPKGAHSQLSSSSSIS